MWRPTLFLLAGASFLLASCTLAPVPAGNQSANQSPDQSPLEQPISSSPTSAPADATTDATTDATAAQPTASVAGIPGDLLNNVLSDAAQRTGVATDALVVTRAEVMTWPDGSLGCPEPDMFYTQALVDGYWIVLEAESQTLDYRADSDMNWRICDNPQPAKGVSP
jgi:hypothetical protein